MTTSVLTEQPGGRVALVVGASSKIAEAIIDNLRADTRYSEIIAVSRQLLTFSDRNSPVSVKSVVSDYSENSIRTICQELEMSRGLIRQVIICNGILHDEQIRPEKRTEDLNPDNLQKVYNINAIVPMLWIKNLKPLLQGKQNCVVSAFSARIGSIADNRRGGWYSYRSSKAALNMMLKTAAVEYSRIAKGVNFLAFHPGTTDTPLSKPFQKSVKKDKLFAPQFVAKKFLSITEGILDRNNWAAEQDNIQYLDWNNQSIPW